MTEEFAKELKNIFLFFVFSLIIIFLILNIIQFFNFINRQVEVLIETPAQALLQATPTLTFPLLPHTSTVKENSLEIVKLGLETPLVFAASTDVKAISQDLKNGAVVYPGSSLPGQAGKLIVLGHSSPLGWPKIRYDWIFSNLANLEFGDNVLINFEHNQYNFKVSRKIFLEKGQAIPENTLDDSKEFLYLVTCWPPGKDFKRLVIEAF